jgi:hypothetical protein
VIYILLPICILYIALYYNGKFEYNKLKEEYLVTLFQYKKLKNETEFPMGNGGESHLDNIEKDDK